MPSLRFFVLSVLFVCISILALKLTALLRKMRFTRVKNDCKRALSTLQRYATSYAQRDPALLHSEILLHIAEDFLACGKDLNAKKISRRKATGHYLALEKRAQALTHLYEQSAADRADYSDQSNAYALLNTVIPQILARIGEQLDLLTEEQLDLYYIAHAGFVRLKTCADSPRCDWRMLYAECALLHVQLVHLTTLS
jgi:hypothetical protein